MSERETHKKQSELINLLSAENVKLRAENKRLRERLADYEAMDLVAKKRTKNSLQIGK